MQGQYVMNNTLVPPQVPWMSIGPSQTWAPRQYPWAVPQPTLPPQAYSLPLNLANSVNTAQPIQPQMQTPAPIPVTTTTVTTTLLAGAQLHH